MRDSIFHWLQTLSETQLYGVLADLLRTMGYSEVRVTHGQHELGRDLVFLEKDRLGRETWRGIQAKTEPISGALSSGQGLRGLLQQCEAALDTPYARNDGAPVNLREVWIVTTKPIREAAKRSAEGKLKDNQKLHIIDGEKLSELLAQHLPQLLDSPQRPLDSYLNALVEHCSSPEQYISFRFSQTIDLADVYVPQQLRLNLVSTPKVALQVLESQDDLLSVNDSSHIWGPLAVHGVLPNSLRRDNLQVIRSLAELLEKIREIDVYPNVVSRHVKALNHCKDLLTQERTGNNSLFFRTVREDNDGTRHAVVMIRSIELDEEILSRAEESCQDLVPNGKTFLGYLRSIWSLAEVRDDADRTTLALTSQILADHVNRTLPNRELDQLQKDLSSVPDFLDDVSALLRRSIERGWAALETVTPEGIRNPQWTQEVFEALSSLDTASRHSRAVLNIENESLAPYQWQAFEVLKKAPKAVVVGDLGAGKSTLLKRLCDLHASGARHDVVPVLCSLGSVKYDSTKTILDTIVSSATDYFPGLERFPLHELLIFLDGFDEIEEPDFRTDLLSWMESPLCTPRQILLASRSSALSEVALPSFLRLELMSFDQDQIVDFINNFPWEHRSQARALATVIQSSERLSELAKSPLMLTLIVILSTIIGVDSIPRRREILYGNIADLFLGEWDRSKKVTRPQTIQQKDLRLKILKKVAYLLYAARKRSFTEAEIIEALSAVPATRKLSYAAARTFILDLVRDCVLSPTGKRQTPTGHVQKYSFFHFSFQEYLAAADICDDISTDRITETLESFLRDTSWWGEVLVFYSSIKRDIGELLFLVQDWSIQLGKYKESHQALTNLLCQMLATADFTQIPNLSRLHPVAANAVAEIRSTSNRLSN